MLCAEDGRECYRYWRACFAVAIERGWRAARAPVSSWMEVVESQRSSGAFYPRAGKKLGQQAGQLPFAWRRPVRRDITLTCFVVLPLSSPSRHVTTRVPKVRARIVGVSFESFASSAPRCFKQWQHLTTWSRAVQYQSPLHAAGIWRCSWGQGYQRHEAMRVHACTARSRPRRHQTRLFCTWLGMNCFNFSQHIS